jgi:hypothetical protein
VNFHRNRLNLNFAGLYTGARDDSRFTFEAPFTFNAARVKNCEYFVLNFTGTYDLVRDWGYVNTIQLFARLNNILDQPYQETYGYSSPRFFMLGGVRVIFGLKPQPQSDKEKKVSRSGEALRSRFAPGFSISNQENRGI